jgi:hypothetical protein
LIGNVLNFAGFVRDENDGGASISQVPHDGQKLVSLLRSKHGGGFIENQNFRVKDEHTRNFYTLLNGHGQFLDFRVRLKQSVYNIH